MGEAKLKKARLDLLLARTKPLSQARFDVYTLGSRRSMARFMADELSWWANEDETLIGFVFRDTTDNDFGWIALARDQAGRFRSVELQVSLKSPDYSEKGLRAWLGEALENTTLEELGHQGDEPKKVIDLLTVSPGVAPDSLHPYFRELTERSGRAPARAVVREMSRWLDPADPHLVDQFQRHQFDQRLWELYLWAAFREMSFDVTQLEAPDFLCRSPLGEVTVEATTIAPSTMGPMAAHPNPKTKEEISEFLDNYMPLKFGSALVSKLNKVNKDSRHYWELEHAREKPFLLAIADFHRSATEEELGSMTYTQSSIWQYLYGVRVSWDVVDGQLVLVPSKVASHQYGEKVAPSGFFDLPDAENVSAVLFSNAGTIAKFDRMGVLAGYAPPNHRYFRTGLRANPDPNSPTGLPFHVEVGADNYDELWADELQVFHNPNARLPLARHTFGGIAQHWFEDGNLHSSVPDHHVLSSYTMIMQITDE